MKRHKPYRADGMWKDAPSESFEKAQNLRKNSTSVEEILWAKLRNHQLDNVKFRRQHPIGIYIADFYCHAFKLVIELDGDYHLLKEQQEKDQERTAYLVANGLQVLRFTNTEIEIDCQQVIQKIRTIISELKNLK